MIEPARIITIGKIKTNANTLKQNINFWNTLHHLGLDGLRERPDAVTWNIANCVIALRKLETSMVEIHLLVARRQADYRWVFGLHPEEPARETWNRILQLVPRESWDTPVQLLGRPLVQIRSDIAELIVAGQMSELARLVHINEIAVAQYGKDSSGRAIPGSIAKIHEQIAQAEAFKQAQDALHDLIPDQLADVFLQMIPERKTSAKRVRRQTKTKKTKQQYDSVNPKRKTTEAQWRRDWKNIEPLFNQGQKIKVIADQLGMSRDRVSAIISWATAKPKE